MAPPEVLAEVTVLLIGSSIQGRRGPGPSQVLQADKVCKEPNSTSGVYWFKRFSSSQSMESLLYSLEFDVTQGRNCLNGYVTCVTFQWEIQKLATLGHSGGPLCYIGINLDPSKPKGMPLGLKLHSAQLHTASLPNIYKAKA